jgi:DNA-directed RNA polymerase subunit M/transcription elongation factor TFIIS
MSQSSSTPKQVPCPKCKNMLVLETTTSGSKKQCPQCNAVFVISGGKTAQHENKENAVAKQDDGYDLKTDATPQVPRADLSSRKTTMKEGADRCDSFEEEGEEQRAAVWQPKRPPPVRLLRDKTFKAPFSGAFRKCYVMLLIASLIMGSITAVLLPYMDIGGKDSKNPADQPEGGIKNMALVRSFDGLNVGALSTGATFLMILIGVPFAMLMAALGLAIFRDTFEGSDEFASWPRDWLNSIFISASFILVPLFLGAFPALVVISFVPGIGWFRMPLVVVCSLILFPLCFLSALENKSPVMLYSKPVWNSVRNTFPVWRTFYGLTLSIGVAISLFLRIPLYTWLTAICGSFLLPTYFMVYFRMLGKLAWYCSGGYDEYAEAAE